MQRRSITLRTLQSLDEGNYSALAAIPLQSYRHVTLRHRPTRSATQSADLILALIRIRAPMVGLNTPLALYSIPAALAISFYPHFRMIITVSKFSKWNNVAPRANLDKLKDSGKASPELAAQLDRMKFAHVNGLETFPLWIGGILTGIIAGLDNYTLNAHALAFLILRSLYNYSYINQRGQVLSTFRSIFYMGSVAVSFSLIFKAASAC